MALTRKFVSDDVLKAKPSNVTQTEWEQFIEIIRATDVSNMLGGADAVLPPEMTAEKVDSMTLEELRTTVMTQQETIQRKVKDRVLVGSDSKTVPASVASAHTEEVQEPQKPTEVEQLVETVRQVKQAATLSSRRSSISSIDSLERRRLHNRSPFEHRQDQLPPFETLLRERGIEIAEWSWNIPTELEGGPDIESPDNNLSHFVTRLRQENIGLQWEREEGWSERNEPLELFKPLLDPQFLVL